jgi:YfiH family protein
VTNQPNITLLMRFADCVPILLFDPVRYVTGIIHAGWKGTISEIASKVIIAMAGRYGSKPADIQAAIGPSIGPDHYSVGVEVIDKVKITFGQDAESLLHNDDDAVKFDLWAANQLILVKSGVKNIEISGLCTACNQYDWFSHRGERGNTGRFGAVIGLRI